MKMIFLASAILTVVLLSGCSATGTKIEAEKLSTITKGVTTEQQILDTFGKPDSITTTPDRRILAYNHRQDNSTSRSVMATTGSVLGGVVGGSIGSLAGGLAGRNAVSRQVNRESLTVEIDASTQKVVNYRFQQSQ